MGESEHRMLTNPYVQMLFLFTGTGIVTYWFVLRLLNPFIDSAIAIVKCALYVLLSFFVGCVDKVGNVLEKKIGDPIRNVIQRIHIPLFVKVVLYFTVGVGIFVLDHVYGTKIYEADETTFYHVFFRGTTYWITEAGLVIGGFFIGLATLLVLIEILKKIDNLLSRPIRISVVIQK